MGTRTEECEREAILSVTALRQQAKEWETSSCFDPLLDSTMELVLELSPDLCLPYFLELFSVCPIKQGFLCTSFDHQAQVNLLRTPS